MKQAIFPLSADPITLGHLNIIDRASKIFDRLVVLVLENQAKSPVFSIEERTNMVEQCLSDNSKVEVVSYQGLLTDFAVQQNIFNVVRGIRDTADLEYEIFLESGHRKQQVAQIEFCYFLADEKYRTIKSSFVKSILLAYGSVIEYVPVLVKKQLEKNYLKQRKILITGGVASGKSYLMKHFSEYLKQKKINFFHVDFDEIVACIYRDFEVGKYLELQKKMIIHFGEVIVDKEYVSKPKVSRFIFSNNLESKEVSRHLLFLEEVLSPYILLKYRETIKDKEGWLFLDAPVDGIGKSKKLDVLTEVNYDVLLVDVPDEIQIERLVSKRGLSRQEAEQRMRMNCGSTKKALLEKHLKNKNSEVLIYKNQHPITNKDLDKLFAQLEAM